MITVFCTPSKYVRHDYDYDVIGECLLSVNLGEEIEYGGTIWKVARIQSTYIAYTPVRMVVLCPTDNPALLTSTLYEQIANYLLGTPNEDVPTEEPCDDNGPSQTPQAES